MRYYVTLLLSLVFFLFLATVQMRSQSPLKVAVISVEKIAPFPVPHLNTNFDRKVRFKLTNTTGKPIKVFGSLVENALQPIRYVLQFDGKTSTWIYPTTNGKPVKWKAVSGIYKQLKVLQPEESLEFSSFLSSTEDQGKRFKVTVQINIGKSKRVQEVRSEEFNVEENKTTAILILGKSRAGNGMFVSEDSGKRSKARLKAANLSSEQ